MRRLMRICLALCAGMALALAPLPGMAVVLAAGAVLALGLLLLAFPARRRISLLLIPLALGLVWGYGHEVLFLSPARALWDQEMEISGEALDYGEAYSGGQWVTARIEVGGRKLKAALFLRSAEELLEPGDSFTVTAKLQSSASDGDYYSYSQGVYLRGYERSGLTVSHCSRTPVSLLPRYIAHQLAGSISRVFPEDVQGYALALTTGDRTELTLKQKADLKHAGIYHALALSGMHMSVLVGMLFFLKKPRRRALIGMPLCIAFALVTGGSPSMVRACVMECFLLSGDALSREADRPTSLASAGALLMLQNPWCVLNWGLQLSFLSVIGICLLVPKIYRPLPRKGPNKRLRPLRSFLRLNLAVSLSAIAFTLPLMALYFGCVSLISPITNLLTGTVISWCFGGSLISALLGLVLPSPAKLLGGLFAWGFRYVELAAGFLADLPFSCIYTDTYYGVAAAALIYFILLLLLLGKGVPRTIPICCGIVGVSVCMLLLFVESAAPSFTTLDVGQGQCLIFETGSGVVMVDCGGNTDNAGDLAADHLISRGVRRIALLVLTHYDQDHVGGVPELLSRLPADVILMPDTQEEGRREIEAAAFGSGARVYPLSGTMDAALGSCQFQIYAPELGGTGNDACLAVRAQLPALSVLVTGDMDLEAERRLIARCHPEKTDILVAGHHGSKTSTSTELLREIQPQAVVISVGRNSYGHPAQETLGRIEQAGAAICRTDLTGTIYIKGGSQWHTNVKTPRTATSALRAS